MSSLSTLPKGDSAWLLRKSIQRIMQQVSVLETNIGSSTTGNSANTQVIFNDNGTLRGDTGLTFNKTTDTLGTGRLTTSGDAIVCSSTGDFYVGSTVTPQFKVERATGSATITGDLTVDTSTLKVDSANNRVGIGTASPTSKLHVFGSGTNTFLTISDVGANYNITLGTQNANIAQLAVFNTTIASGSKDFWLTALSHTFNTWNGSAYSNRFVIASDGVATWSNVGGVAGTAMTLNSTGLGVGISPSYKLNIGAQNPTGGNIAQFYNNATSSLNGAFAIITQYGVQDWFMGQPAGVSAFTIGTGTTSKSEFFRIDAGGNVGVGVTPRAWATGYRAFNVGIYTALTDNQGGATHLTNNAYYDTVDSRWEAVTNNRALRYDQDTADGGHKWYSAPSVAANAALVWSTPMILDASGNLIWSPASTPPTLTTNGQLTVNATSNTNLRFSYRGSDGVTRVANITLA